MRTLGAPALAAAWAAVIAASVAQRRPPPARLRRLAATAASGSSGGPRPTRRVGADLAIVAVGQWVVRRMGSRAGPVRARQAGWAVVGGLGALITAPLLAPAAIALGWSVPGLRARRRAQRWAATLAAGLPEVIDLLRLAVESGLNVPLALGAVVQHSSGPLVDELAQCLRQAAAGRRLSDALDDLPVRAGEVVRPLVSALTASERYGAPVGDSLERLADEVRRDRRRLADEAVRRVPVKLLFPLVMCTLPAFALLTVAPLIASAIRSLRL